MLPLVVIFLCATPAFSVIVDTEYGQVRGKTMAVNNTRQVKNIDVFRAIPYAKDPSGERRFARPQPPDNWDVIFEADRAGDACPQIPFGTLTPTHPDWERFSEDCLHLDITSPGVSQGPYPVMVWVHGGAYSQGANVQYPGHFLSMFDVVVVSINYRLGALGFSFTGNAASPGNAGLWDQKMALEFVVNNIAAFGGDPNDITVFGESAGGTSTGLLMVSPETSGLFQKAILESGVETNYWAINSPESQPENYTRLVARNLGCEGNDQELMDCLREFPFEFMVNSTLFSCAPGYSCLGMAPVVDGEGGFLPKIPIELREDGDIMTGPIMTGITKDDGALLASLSIPELFFGCCNRSTFQTAIRERFLSTWLPRFDNETAEDIFQAALFNYSPWPHIYENEANRESIVKMMTDAQFGYAWDTQLKDHQKLAPSYGVVFNYTSDLSTAPEWMAVSHAAEIAYVWGFPMMSLNPQIRNDSEFTSNSTYNDEDIEYSLFIQELWTNFAKYGNPTPEPVRNPLGGSTTWPAFTMDEVKVLSISNPFIDVLEDYRQKDYAFWRTYMHFVATGIPTDEENNVDKIEPRTPLFFPVSDVNANLADEDFLEMLIYMYGGSFSEILLE